MADAVAAPRPTAAPVPRPGILDITPYKGGAAAVKGVAHSVKLSANENPMGCSPAAKAAFAAAADGLSLYPEGSARALRDAIAQVHSLDAERIVCGAGSDELIQLMVRAYAGPGDEVLYSAHGFLVYRLAAKQVGATPVAAPESDLTADVDALLDHVSPATKLVFLANPNNPTGTMVTRGDLERLHAGLPPHVLLVVDGAYAEYVDEPDYESGLAMAERLPNVVATRTFSKIHGLAALRLGWAYGPEAVIDVLHRMRGPFNVSVPAMAAGEAAIRDAAFPTSSKAHNAAERERVSAVARDLGLLACESLGNFVLLRFPTEAGRTAADADAHFKADGLIVRGMDAYGLGDCLRVSIGRTEDNDRVIAALRAFMGAS